MKKSHYSGFDNYTLLCDNNVGVGFKFGYEYFLKFKEVKKFINQIANSPGDTFTYENDIYTKRITSSHAQNMLTSIFNNRCDYKVFKGLANQLGIRV